MIYIFIKDTGVIAVQGGPEAILVLRNLGIGFADDLAQLAGHADDAKSLSDLFQAALNANGLGAMKVFGAIAFGGAVSAGVVAAAGAVPLAGSIAAAVGFGYIAGKAYEELFDAAVGLGERIGEAAYKTWWDTPDGISPTVNTATTGALTWEPPRQGGSFCPLILDLDGGGISNSGIEPGYPILFDHDGDGLRNATGWVGAGEAIVVRDLNGNGTIDSGREIFGDNTLLTRGPKAGQRAVNGFEALADLDSNNDGQFNAADAAFASVRLWKDANQNGISEAGELFTFAQLGVQGIKVSGWVDGTRLTDADGELTGNRQILAGTFTWGNGGNGQAGTTGLAADLTFTNNAFYRKFSDDPTPTAAALALPNMQGSGLVRDLRAAMCPGMHITAEIRTGQRRIKFHPKRHRAFFGSALRRQYMCGAGLTQKTSLLATNPKPRALCE
jgi:hypothetical protein